MQAEMNTIDIALMTDKIHSHVKRTVDMLVTNGLIEKPLERVVPFVGTSGLNRKTKAYVFVGDVGKLSSIILIAQRSPEYIIHIVKRWKELEAVANATRIHDHV